MTQADLDVMCIGNAIVDVLAHCEDETILGLGLNRDTMTLIGVERAQQLYNAMGAVTEMSGGSASNTAAGIASLGGQAGFVGKVRDDQFGEVFVHDIRTSGVVFETPPAASGPATARCLIFITSDAQRTMNTYLGACVNLRPEDIDPDFELPSDDGVDKVVELEHQGVGGERMHFPIYLESAGTLRLLSALPKVLGVLKTGGTVVVDELDLSLHTQAAEKLLKIFKEDGLRPRSSNCGRSAKGESDVPWPFPWLWLEPTPCARTRSIKPVCRPLSSS